MPDARSKHMWLQGQYVVSCGNDAFMPALAAADALGDAAAAEVEHALRFAVVQEEVEGPQRARLACTGSHVSDRRLRPL